MDLQALAARNAERWRVAKLTRSAEFIPVAQRLVAAKSRYQAVGMKTGVPWFVIAVIHEREASQNWTKSIAQGDPWDAVSTHVPIGRGPFTSWEDAADDALVECPPHAALNKDWSIGGVLTLLERYNGLGYASGPKNAETGQTYPPQPSPYVWSGTDQYTSGKYIRDHVFVPDVVDKQLGCAGLILAMQQVDSSITFGASAPAPVTPAAPPTPVAAALPIQTTPPSDEPQKSALSSFITGFLSAFKRN